MTRTTTKTLFTLLVILFAGFATACGETDEHGDEEEHAEPVDDACEHAQEGPFEDVTADDGTGTAPDVSTEHTAYRIGLNETGDTTYGGSVSFMPEEAGEYHIFLGTDDATVEVTQDDTTVPVEMEQMVDSAEHCAEVQYQWTFDLDSTSAPYTIDISGTSDTTVLMAIVHGGDHAHEE
ncbi:MAG: hypothetical protein ACQEVA_12085 [Myxococcota bacterium]